MPLLLPSRSSPLPSTLRHRLCSYSYSYSVARGGHLLCSRHWPRARRLHAALAADSRVVLGCGLVTLDYLATVDAYPRPDDKIRTGKLQISGGGNAGNALTAAARLGLNTRVISKVANDETGGTVLSELNEAGIDTSHVIARPSLHIFVHQVTVVTRMLFCQEQFDLYSFHFLLVTSNNS